MKPHPESKQIEPLDEKLARVVFYRDREPHITLSQEICVGCKIDRVCVTVCPAGNYKYDEKACQTILSTESCMECGACRIVCTEGAVSWSWPRGGFGVCYLLG
jgi:ferredoxin like protein